MGPKSGERVASLPDMAFRLIAAAALFLATLATYGGVGSLGWHARDDEDYVLRAEWISQGVSGEGLVRVFSAPHLSNWHPVTSLSHMLDSEFFGPDPGPPHRLNAILHALNAVLLFAALCALTQSLTPSLFAAALFAVHPLGVETVAWISERKNLLSAGFGFGALWCWAAWAQRRSLGGYLGALGLLALSLLSKAMLVTFPFALLLFDVWPLQRLRLDRTALASLRPLLVEKLPFFLLAAVFSVVTWLAQGSALWHPVSLAGRVARGMLAYAVYVQHVLWPSQLVVHYPYLPEVETAAVIGATIFVVGASGAALACLRRWPFVAVGWFFFLGTLVPVSGLVQVGTQAMADRYMYVPIVGLAIVLVWGAHALVPSRGRGAEALLGILFAAVLIGCVHQTRRYLDYWQSDLVLYTRAVEHATDNHVALTIRCALLGREGRSAEAVASCREAVRIEPGMASARHELGVRLIEADEPAAALEHLDAAARLAPERRYVLFDLGRAYESTGESDKAAQAYARQLMRTPSDDALELMSGPHRSAVTLDVKAAALADRGRLGEARAAAREAESLARASGDETLADAIADRASRYSPP